MSRFAQFRLVLSTALTLAALAALALCYLCRHADHWLLSFFYGYAIHLAAAGFLAALFAVLVVPRNGLALLLLLATPPLAMSVQRIADRFAADPALLAEPGAGSFRIVTFNTLNENHAGGPRIADALLELDADVVFLLEATPMRRELDRLSAAYPYRAGCRRPSETCTSMILSRHPVTRRELVDLSHISPARFVSAEINIHGTPVRFALLHTTKPYYDGIQCDELDEISDRLRPRTGSLVVAGDFNSSILAPCMRSFLRYHELRTAPLEPATWPVQPFAAAMAIPIDHVFAREPLAIRSTERLPGSLGSNHFGIVSDILLPRPELLARRVNS